MKSIYYPDFIANNQKDRANNLITGENKLAHCQTIRKDIQEFRNSHQLKRVIVLWTANTERMTEQLPGVNDTYDNLVKALKESHQEIAPSTVFALAAMEEDCVFINGSPQNTIV